MVSPISFAFRQHMQLKEGAPGVSFSFYCKQTTHQSSSAATEYAGAILEGAVAVGAERKEAGVIGSAVAVQKGSWGSSLFRISVCVSLPVGNIERLTGRSRRASQFLKIFNKEVICRCIRKVRELDIPFSPDHNFYAASMEDSPFAMLLKPLGLVHKYCMAFMLSGIQFGVRTGSESLQTSSVPRMSVQFCATRQCIVRPEASGLSAQ